jgi:hypothetical protein
MQKIFDTVICVGPKHLAISLISIRSIHSFAAPRKIFVVTAGEHFPFFRASVDASVPLHLVDEDEVIEGASLGTIRDALSSRNGTGARAGWYFQQFLKMAMCARPDMAEYCLIWDSDTVALRPLSFFDEKGRVLVNPKTEHHRPYFETIRKLLGIERQVNFSFITEHLMVSPAHMRELIAELSGDSSQPGAWVWHILDAIPDRDLGGSAFSEYETYGNFMAMRYPGIICSRKLKTTRSAGLRFGDAAMENIHYLMWAGYSVATFETNPRPRIVIALYRPLVRAVCAYSRRARSRSDRAAARLDAAAELCREAAHAVLH